MLSLYVEVAATRVGTVPGTYRMRGHQVSTHREIRSSECATAAYELRGWAKARGKLSMHLRDQLLDLVAIKVGTSNDNHLFGAAFGLLHKMLPAGNRCICASTTSQVEYKNTPSVSNGACRRRCKLLHVALGK